MSAKKLILDALCDGNTDYLKNMDLATIEEWVLAYAYGAIKGWNIIIEFDEDVEDADGDETLTFDCEDKDSWIIGYGLVKGYAHMNAKISDESKMIFKECVERYGLTLLPRIQGMCETLGIKLSHDFHKNAILRHHFGSNKRALS